MSMLLAGRRHVPSAGTRSLFEEHTSEREARLAAERAEAVANLDQRQEVFAMMSSHELRTPLTLVLGVLEFLLEPGPPVEDDARTHLLRSATDGARRLLRLVENLEIVAAGDSLQVKREVVNLLSVVSGLLAEIPDELDAVRLDVSPEVVAVADAERLSQVLRNLLRNAVMATPAGGNVEIVARQDADHVVVEIRDQGRGFEPRNLSEVRPSPEPFSIRPRAHRGLGLGLWAASQLIEVMGGELRTANNSDRGATVTVILPRAGAASLHPIAGDLSPAA